MIKQGNLRADKVQFETGIGCCVWYPFPNEDSSNKDEEAGLCFDFNYKDIDDFIILLSQLKELEPSIYIEENIEQKKPRPTWKIIKDNLRYFRISFAPFNWKFRLKSIFGAHVGPFIIRF